MVPLLPSEYFHEPDRWWNQPGHYGHGLFDLLTPAMADSIIQGNVTESACEMASDAAYSLLGAMATNLSRSVASSKCQISVLDFPLKNLHVMDSCTT